VRVPTWGIEELVGGEIYMSPSRLLGAVGWIAIPIIIVFATIYF
jgi:hypothetical protein